MGTNCSCITTSNPPVNIPIPVIHNNSKNQQHLPLDQVYVTHPQPLINQRQNIVNPPLVSQIISKRTSQPSLMCLNKQITNLLNTFQNMHGTIQTSIAGSNKIKNSRNFNRKTKIKELTNEISEIQNKKKKNNDDMILGNSSILQWSNNISQKISQKQSQTSNIKVKSLSKRKNSSQVKSQVNENLSQTISSKSSHRQNIQSKDILHAQLVNQQIYEQKIQIMNKYNLIEGNHLEIWENFQMQTFKLTLDLEENIKEFTKNPIFIAAITSIIVYYEKFNIVLPSYKKIDITTYLVKIWINGAKRAIKVKNLQNSPLQIFQKAIQQLYNHNNIFSNPSIEIYHLGGWCPQCLLLQQIVNKQNLWERLIQNFSEGNILISFSISQHNQEYYYPLRKIKQNRIVEVSNPIKGFKRDFSQNSKYQYTWQDICERVQKIYINWNPSIYSFCEKFDNSWKIRKSQTPFENQQICLVNNPQYLIKIPKHDQDFQIRVFVDRHLNQFRPDESISLKLFQYQGTRILNPKNAIRTIECSQRELVSDVFIFEKSEDVDYFVLVITEGTQSLVSRQIFFSILFLSFIEIQIIELPLREILLKSQTTDQITMQNKGMGINSPNFFKNLHYSIRAPAQSDLQIFVETPNQLQFSLILFQDVNNCKDLAKLDFETVLNQNYTTQVFQGYGYLQKQLKGENYILVIAGLTYAVGQINIQVNIVSKLLKRNKEIEDCYSNIKFERIYFNPTFIKSYQIKWSKQNSGPRKRLKTTTTPIYHPASTFSQFFKNPSVSVKLEKGKYQFNLCCQEYKKQFQKDQNQNLQPPALSLCLLKQSQNGKGYKIILDDAFYVPTGYGFWSTQTFLQEGKYMIICTRINKCNAKGTLKIRSL